MSVVDPGFEHRVACKCIYFHSMSCYESQDSISEEPSEKARSLTLNFRIIIFVRDPAS